MEERRYSLIRKLKIESVLLDKHCKREEACPEQVEGLIRKLKIESVLLDKHCKREEACPELARLGRVGRAEGLIRKLKIESVLFGKTGHENALLCIFNHQKIRYHATMVGFKQARDMYRLQKEAKRAKKELKRIQVEAEAQGVMVIVSADQEILEIRIDESVDRVAIPALLKDTLNRALSKAQIVASEKMQGVMGEMGLPTDKGLRGMSE